MYIPHGYVCVCMYIAEKAIAWQKPKYRTAFAYGRSCTTCWILRQVRLWQLARQLHRQPVGRQLADISKPLQQHCTTDTRLLPTFGSLHETSEGASPTSLQSCVSFGGWQIRQWEKPCAVSSPHAD